MSKLEVLALLLLLNNILVSPLSEPGVGEIISEYNFDNIAKGSYSFRYKTPENIERQETGYVGEDGDFIVNGFYSYYDDDEQHHYVSYHADKNGYRINKPEKVNDTPRLEPDFLVSALG